MRLCAALRVLFHTDHVAHVRAPACTDRHILLHGKRCFQIIAFVISEKRIARLPDRIIPDPGASEHLQHLRPDLVMPPAGAVPAGGILSRARYRKALPERWAISQHRQGIREKAPARTASGRCSSMQSGLSGDCTLRQRNAQICKEEFCANRDCAAWIFSKKSL